MVGEEGVEVAVGIAAEGAPTAEVTGRVAEIGADGAAAVTAVGVDVAVGEAAGAGYIIPPGRIGRIRLHLTNLSMPWIPLPRTPPQPS